MNRTEVFEKLKTETLNKESNEKGEAEINDALQFIIDKTTEDLKKIPDLPKHKDIREHITNKIKLFRDMLIDKEFRDNMIYLFALGFKIDDCQNYEITDYGKNIDEEQEAKKAKYKSLMSSFI